MASSQELSRFLAEVEKRAFKQAMYAVRNSDAALDIVQDSMIRLAEKYGDHPVEEFPPLFQRILHNIINDWFRRTKVRKHWTILFSQLFSEKQDDEINEAELVDAVAIKEKNKFGEDAGDALERFQLLNIIDIEVQKLPLRQREAFLLRYWEEMDVAETASIMGCSEGSVKTHCSRAVQALSKALRNQGITL